MMCTQPCQIIRTKNYSYSLNYSSIAIYVLYMFIIRDNGVISGLMIVLKASPVLSFCATLMPNHGGLPSQTSSSPFELDVSEDLTFREDRTYSYMPGVTYNSKLNTVIQALVTSAITIEITKLPQGWRTRRAGVAGVLPPPPPPPPPPPLLLSFPYNVHMHSLSLCLLYQLVSKQVSVRS